VKDAERAGTPPAGVYGAPGTGPNPERRILLLCSRCGAYALAQQATGGVLNVWIDRRPFRQRVLLREILGYRPAPYVPPDCPDPEELYRTACNGWCLNGSG
jgi:hypothetical protein